MRHPSFLLAAASIFMVACASEPTEVVFENGDRFILHVDAPGEPVKAGDLVSFRLDVFNADSVITSNRDQTIEEGRVIIPPVDSVAEANNTLLKALRLMSQGDSATLYQPIDSLARLPPGMDREAGFRIEIVMVEVGDSAAATAFQENAAAELAAQQAAAEVYSQRRPAVQDSVETLLEEFRRRGASGAGYSTTASGLMYKVLEPGTGRQPKAGETVTVSYYGALSADDSSFDDSYKRGRGIQFPIGAGQVIPGWDEGIALLNQGARAMLIIPSDIGYGERGSGASIPPGAELAFYVQLDDIQ